MEVRRGELSHLFDAELRYRDDIAPVVPAEGRQGELIGSGDVTATGERLRGTILWPYFAANCADQLVTAGSRMSRERRRHA